MTKDDEYVIRLLVRSELCRAEIKKDLAKHGLIPNWPGATQGADGTTVDLPGLRDLWDKEDLAFNTGHIYDPPEDV